MAAAASSAGRTPDRGVSPEVLRTFVERMSIALYEHGMPRMPARVFTLLLCSENESVTVKQLTTALGVSPAAISSAVKYLLETSQIEREPIPGSRQDHYRLPSGGIFAALMRRSEKVPDVARVAEDGVAMLGADSAGGQRLADIAEFLRFMDEEMRGVWERWRARSS